MSRKALIIDDEDSLREVVAELLELWDFETVEVEDGEMALNYLAENNVQFDLIFIDVNLPNMSGKELYEQLFPRFPKTKFIFMSGYQIGHDELELPETGEFSYLKKPFRMVELKTLVEDLLSN